MNIEIAGLATLLNKSQEELTAALKDGDNWKADAGKTLQQLFESHLSAKLKEKSDEYQKAKDNLIKKAVKETAEKFEEQIRSAVGITEKVEGETLIEQFNTQIETLRKGASNLTDDQVKASPVYVNALREQQKKFDDQIKAVKDEKQKLEQEYARKEVMQKVRSEAHKFFDKLDVIEAATPETKQAWKELMELSIEKSGNYKLDETGKLIVTDDKGEPLQSESGKLIEMEDIFKKSTAHVLTKASQSRSGGGAGDDGGSGGGSSKKASDYPKPKTKKEFTETSKKMRAAGVPAKEMLQWQNSFDHRALPEQ